MSSLSLAELQTKCKDAGVPSSGNKATLMQRLSGVAGVGSFRTAAVAPTPNVVPTGKTNTTRVGIKFDAKTCADLGLKLVAVSTDASGSPEYIYHKATTATATVGKPKSPIAKKTSLTKAAASKAGGKAPAPKACAGGACMLGNATDEVFDEVVQVFVARLEDKKVPVKLCQELLGYFNDAKDIPKQKMKVYEELALQTHYETDSDDDGA